MSASLFGDDVLFTQRFLKSGGAKKLTLDGIFGPATNRAVQAFEEASRQLASSIGQFDLRTEQKIFSLHVPAQELARKFLRAVRAEGIDARIISGTRSFEEQNVLFRKGRFGNAGLRVTNARGGESNHNFGLAWDIGIFAANGAFLGESPLYKKAAQIGLDLGLEKLEWGGNWKTFPDTPHYQLISGLTISEVRRRFENGEPYF